MAVQVTDLRCSGCGGALAPSARFCDWCSNPVAVPSLTSIFISNAQEAMKLASALEKDVKGSPSGEMAALSKFTMGGCYLKLKMYDKALQKFEAAMDDNLDNAELPFYMAICLLKGKKAFLTPLADIKKAMEYVNAALMLEPRGVFHYFLAYIKYDFHARHCLRVSPDYQEELRDARANGLSIEDATMLFEVLAVECPAELVP